MNFREVIRVALRALARNKMRTILTYMLGIIIGVGAVICTVAIGQGAGKQVQAQIQNLGTNMVMVFAGSVNTGGVRMGSRSHQDAHRRRCASHPAARSERHSRFAERDGPSAGGKCQRKLGHADNRRLSRISGPAQLAGGRR